MTEFSIGTQPQPSVDEPADPFGEATPAEIAAVRKSPLEALRTALSAPVVREPLVLRVPSRPGITLEFRTNIDEDKERKVWEKRATKKSRRHPTGEETDSMHYAQLILANTNTAVFVDGVAAHDEEDTPITFRHRQLWDMVGATAPDECIKKLYANDPHVLMASGEVLLASGFDDDLTSEAGPTQAS